MCLQQLGGGRVTWTTIVIFFIIDGDNLCAQEEPPLFVAVAGSTSGYSMPDSMAILGPDMTRARLRSAIEACGGVSKKAAKRLEKAYAELGA